MALSISLEDVSGDVHCRKTKMSKSTLLEKWRRTSSLLVVSVANSFGRYTTLLPHFSAIFAISSSSVETYVSFTYFDFKEEVIVCAISGIPPNCIIFFLGIPLLPPLAGMMETIFVIFSSTSN